MPLDLVDLLKQFTSFFVIVILTIAIVLLVQFFWIQRKQKSLSRQVQIHLVFWLIVLTYTLLGKIRNLFLVDWLNEGEFVKILLDIVISILKKNSVNFKSNN
jgi:hypothetical protein